MCFHKNGDSKRVEGHKHGLRSRRTNWRCTRLVRCFEFTSRRRGCHPCLRVMASDLCPGRGPRTLPWPRAYTRRISLIQLDYVNVCRDHSIIMRFYTLGISLVPTGVVPAHLHSVCAPQRLPIDMVARLFRPGLGTLCFVLCMRFQVAIKLVSSVQFIKLDLEASLLRSLA